MNNEAERAILRSFFDTVSAVQSLDNSISDFKIVRDTQNKLKIALRDVPHKCTCSRRTWGGICEVCQASDKEMVYLRNFYNQIRNAKKHNMTPSQVQEFIMHTKESFK